MNETDAGCPVSAGMQPEAVVSVCLSTSLSVVRSEGSLKIVYGTTGGIASEFELSRADNLVAMANLVVPIGKRKHRTEKRK